MSDTQDVKKLMDELCSFSSQGSQAYYEVGKRASLLFDLMQKMTDIARGAKMKYGQIIRLKKVYEFCRDAKITEEERVALGVTKLHIMAKHLDTAHVTRWMEKAKKLNCNALEEALHSVVMTSGAINFKLCSDELDDVRSALVAAGAIKKGKALIGKEQALHMIVKEWLEFCGPAAEAD